MLYRIRKLASWPFRQISNVCNRIANRLEPPFSGSNIHYRIMLMAARGELPPDIIRPLTSPVHEARFEPRHEISSENPPPPLQNQQHHPDAADATQRR
jgi:hypothetical protein